MRIGFDARLTHYTHGGIANYCRHLAQSLPALDPANEYFIIHMRQAHPSLPMPANARRLNCFTPAHHRLERTTLGLELRPHRLRLLHSPDFIPPRGSFRSVITIHDLTFLRYPQFLTPESRRYYNDQIRAAVQQADLILTDSHATRSDVLNLLAAPPARVVTVYLAPDSQYQPQPAARVQAVTARYQIPSGYLLFVGTFEPRKNIPNLLTAYAQLPLDAPPLVLAGNTGWLFEETLRQVNELKLNARVKFLQNVATDDLPALYCGASLLVLPSHYEGFGLPVLESFACGTPVIITHRASLPEIAAAAAEQCDPDDPASIADAIRTVLNNSERRQALIAKGFARVKEFSWEKCAKETLMAYRSVLGQ